MKTFKTSRLPKAPKFIEISDRSSGQDPFILSVADIACVARESANRTAVYTKNRSQYYDSRTYDQFLGLLCADKSKAADEEPDDSK